MVVTSFVVVGFCWVVVTDLVDPGAVVVSCLLGVGAFVVKGGLIEDVTFIVVVCMILVVDLLECVESPIMRHSPKPSV